MSIRTGSALIFTAACLLSGLRVSGQVLPNYFPLPNASGLAATYNVNGNGIDLNGPFFRALGSNGRSCASCHLPAQGWSISADEVRLRFEVTQGLDPIFRTNDGSNCDHTVDTTSVSGRRAAYSLLTTRGLLRVAIDMPASSEFDVVGVVNPYGCSERSTLSMYRRPLPSTNLRFLSTLMWDGRESSTQTGTQKITFGTNPADLLADLAHQALDATAGHAQGTVPLTAKQQKDIVDFEMGLITAQLVDYHAGPLFGFGVTGGPANIGTETIPAFFIGSNDPLGGNPHGTPFTSVVFKLFDAWQNSGSISGEDDTWFGRRASIARGQTVFNSKQFNITGVAGLNDDLNTASIRGTCGTCHDSPNIGNHSVSAPLNIGVSDPNGPLDLTYLPVFTLQHKTTHEVKVTTDPGRALITGLWKDVGRFKGPVLRGLASRSPYFHNGSAKTLGNAVDFYDERFAIHFSLQEKKDLVNFLNAL